MKSEFIPNTPGYMKYIEHSYLFWSSRYSGGITNKCSGAFSKNLNSWNVILAETVGSMGISAQKTKKNCHNYVDRNYYNNRT